MVAIVERPVVPLADQARRIAAALEHIAHRNLVQGDPVRAPHVLWRRTPGPVGVPSGQKRCPRRRADRRSGIVLRETKAISRQPVQIRRFDATFAEQTEIAVAHVVSDDQDNVRLRRHSALSTEPFVPRQQSARLVDHGLVYHAAVEREGTLALVCLHSVH